jgi:ribosomal protein L39E
MPAWCGAHTTWESLIQDVPAWRTEMRRSRVFIIMPVTSPISRHWRRAKLEHVADYKTHPRRALRVHVSDLIPGWGPMALIRDVPKVACLPLLKNLRRALSLCVDDWIASWVQCGTNRWCIILDAHLLFDAPPGNPGCRLHPGASQDLVAILPGWRSQI